MCMDLLRAGEEVAVLNEHADYYHMDIMDGHFAKNIALSPDLVKALSSAATIPMEAHLMTEYPNDWIHVLADAGITTQSVHAETVNKDAFRVLRTIESLGCQKGVTLNPATPLTEVQHYLDIVDLVTLMTVDVSYAGQPFIEQMLRKIEATAKFKSDEGLDFKIQIDGSCNAKTFKRLHDAGAEIYILGSSGLFNLDEDRHIAWKKMLESFAEATGQPV